MGAMPEKPEKAFDDAKMMMRFFVASFSRAEALSSFSILAEVEDVSESASNLWGEKLGVDVGCDVNLGVVSLCATTLDLESERVNIEDMEDLREWIEAGIEVIKPDDGLIDITFEPDGWWDEERLTIRFVESIKSVLNGS